MTKQFCISCKLFSKINKKFFDILTLLPLVLYQIFGDKSTACRCISSMRSIVYHQHAVLYLIKSQEYAPSVMIYAYGDDIHADA